MVGTAIPGRTSTDRRSGTPKVTACSNQTERGSNVLTVEFHK